MLETFASYLALAQEAFKVGTPAWDGAFKPAKLAEMLVHSFLEDIWLAFTSSEYTCPPVELFSVGTLQRVEGGKIRFFPNSLFYHEIDGKQCLLNGMFWKVLCRVDTEEQMFCVPQKSTEGIYSTARLREVGECMLMVSQRHNAFFCDVLLKTLRNGLCLAIHDGICGGMGFYLENIGTFFRNGQFEPDQLLLAKMRMGTDTEILDGTQRSFNFPESRRQTKNRAWYRGSGG